MFELLVKLSYCLFCLGGLFGQANSAAPPLELLKKSGGPEGIRTPDLRFRKPLLYPAELPGRAIWGRWMAPDGERSKARSEKLEPVFGRNARQGKI